MSFIQKKHIRGEQVKSNLSIDTGSFTEVILHFKTPLPGLETYQHYNIKKLPESDFILMEAVEEQQVALILVDPHSHYPEYIVAISCSDLKELEADDTTEILIFNTLTTVEDELFINLAAPILINPHKYLGKQLLLPNMMLRAPFQISQSRRGAKTCWF